MYVSPLLKCFQIYNQMYVKLENVLHDHIIDYTCCMENISINIGLKSILMTTLYIALISFENKCTFLAGH